MWFVENDGSIVMYWLGYRIQTSMAFASLFALVAVVVTAMLLQFLFWLKESPKKYRQNILDKRKERGLKALTEGFAAIAAGDAKQAQSLTKRALHCLGEIPITRLLSAQTAQLEGNDELAKAHYTSMLENKETKMIAIKGLLIQARKEGDLEKAIFLAEKALEINSKAHWAASILMDLYKNKKDWVNAERIVQYAVKHSLISQESAKRMLAIIALGKSHVFTLNQPIPDDALKYIDQAQKHLPHFPPVVVAKAFLLNQQNDTKKALRAIENAWKKQPHDDYVKTLLVLTENMPLEKQLSYTEKLLKTHPEHFASHLAVAQVAIKAGNLSKARNHLKIALSQHETVSVCNMMAELERQDQANIEVIQQWQDRAANAEPDYHWVCESCGAQNQSWNTHCGHCDAFDRLVWANNISVSQTAQLNFSA
jgi:HemY protein